MLCTCVVLDFHVAATSTHALPVQSATAKGAELKVVRVVLKVVKVHVEPTFEVVVPGEKVIASLDPTLLASLEQFKATNLSCEDSKILLEKVKQILEEIATVGEKTLKGDREVTIS